MSAPAIPVGTWNVDPGHSTVGFTVRHLGIAKVHGEFTGFEGKLEVAEDGSVSASGSVDAATIDTNVEDRDAHLRSADFFDVDNHPKITFVSTKVVPSGDDSYDITGDFTLHGVTKEITLKAEASGTEEDPWGNTRVGFEVTGEISRGEFGMTFNQALGSGNLVVSDKVKIQIDVSTVKA